MTLSSVFADQKLQEKISNDGYATVPFADEAMIHELRTFYQSLEAMPLTGTQVTMFNPSYEYRKSVDEKIKETCASKAEYMLDGYRTLYSNFMVKEPGPEGNFPLHQDWTYVDEKRHCSYAFWIPMQDVDENNGALHLIKGSHLFLTALRGPYVHEPFHRSENFLKEKCAIPLALKAGEALIWDHRLLHFSQPNISPIPRLAFTLIMVPKEAEVFHCFGIKETNGAIVERYHVGTDFFMKYQIGQRPESVSLIESIEQSARDFEQDEILQMIDKYSKS